MKKTISSLVALVIVTTLLSFSGLHAQKTSGYKIIVNTENPTSSLTRDQISNLFLKKAKRWDNGVQAQPVDLPSKSATRDSFSRAIHRRSSMAIKNFWTKSIFSGKSSPPPELATDAEVVAYVEENAGAIGYVPLTSDTGTAKAIVITDL